jgi:hypothetical protein
MCELRLGVNYFYDDSNDGYDELRDAINNRFNTVLQNGGKIFTTNAIDVWDVFLNSLPEEARQFYNCNACRHFFNRYGGLVTIDDGGNAESVMFGKETPKFFKKAIDNVRKLVLKNSKVNGIFLSEEYDLGYPVTGEHTHFYASQPRANVYRDALKTAGQAMAEKREDFKTLVNALNLYSLDTVNKALALINSDSLYGSRRVKGNAEWFKKVIEDKDHASSSEQRRNIVWVSVATAPNGFTHVRSSMIGTLLDDISEGLSANTVTRRFEDKMSTYMRSQSTPSEMAIFEAERTVVKLGLENSLQRRYAKIEEIPSQALLWKKLSETKPTLRGSGGVFGHLTAKIEDDKVALPTSVMTWEKFKRTVLPNAENLEVLVDNPNRLMGLVTASDESAPNILQWNNPFSWYYHGGVDGEIRRRVEQAGGRYENNEIRVSLIWESYSDLDIHCITPTGRHISYSDKRDGRGGYLDIDMNAGSGQTKAPVENIRWADNAPQGRYRFYVHNFADRNGRENPYKVELEVNGKTYTFHGVANGTGYTQDVFVFDYRKGQDPSFYGQSGQGQLSSNDSWSVANGEFVKVNGITTSPNQWGIVPVTHAGNHIFFLLDGVKDLSEGKGRGFFNEMLKNDLRPIRKTLELYTESTPIEGADTATACGLGFSDENEWNLTVKVTSDNSTRVIKIDRWD